MKLDRVFVNKDGAFQVSLNGKVLPHTWAVREYAEAALNVELRRDQIKHKNDLYIAPARRA